MFVHHDLSTGQRREAPRAFSCFGFESRPREKDRKSVSDLSLKECLERHRKKLIALPGVVGVALGLSPRDSRRCLLLYTDATADPDALPKELDGHPVEIVQTGSGFRPLD